jgi:hypothetical protein
MYVQGRVPELQAATHWKLTGCSITALPPLLSPTGTRISYATFVSVAFYSGKEKFGALLRKVKFYLFYFLKLHDSKSALLEIAQIGACIFFCAIISDFRKYIAFFKVPRLRLFFLFV